MSSIVTATNTNNANNNTNINDISHEKKLECLSCTQAKLSNLETYPKGWDLGRGDAISDQAVSFAREILEEAYHLGMWRSNVFAHLDGSVMLTFKLNGHDVEIDVAEDGYLALRHEVSEEMVLERSEINRSELSELLQQIAPAYLGEK